MLMRISTRKMIWISMLNILQLYQNLKLKHLKKEKGIFKGGEVDDFRLALSEGDKAICEQLKKDLDWDTFIQYVQNVNEKEGECYVYIRGHIVKLNDETHYAVIIMHTIPWL